jgi:uncharacterized membrane protein YtjA (UPF0391 family)
MGSGLPTRAGPLVIVPARHAGCGIPVIAQSHIRRPFTEGTTMLRLALLFFVIGLAAALFGFNLIEGLSFEAARVLCVVFLVLAALVAGRELLRPRDVRGPV